jgi:trans-aconitate methyltransferase
MLPLLAEFGEVEGVESSERALAHCRRRLPEARIHQGHLPDGIPTGARFDLVTAFDVLEHLEDPVTTLRALREVMAPGGALVCTVPAFQFLWSGHDVVNQHHRRYTRPTLRAHLEAGGFELTHESYFNALLFPAVAAVRLFRKLVPERTPGSDLDMPPAPLNRLLAALLSSERHAAARTTVPFGVSLLAVAKAAHPGVSRP